MIQCTHVFKEFTAPGVSPPLRWQVDELSVARGARVLITGPSGCGKTTLFNLLAGLLRPTGGAITVNGTRVDRLGTSAADHFRGRTIGLIFQSFQLISALTVLDNVLLGARYGHKWGAHAAREHAERLLGEVGLADRRRAYVNRLSLGEQQRVAIARALINEPPLLLADEPTASLDRVNAGLVLDLLFRLCDTHGATLLAVSHDATWAPRFERVVDAASWLRAEAEVRHV